MPLPETLELTPQQAASLVGEQLAAAHRDLPDNLDAALDRYVAALGLALQLGPKPAEQVVSAVLGAAYQLARRQDAEGLSALGPALVDLVRQVREAGALPMTAVMDAWAALAEEVGALVGQVGLAFALPEDRRQGMLDGVQARALLLDDASGGLFDVSGWIASLFPVCR